MMMTALEYKRYAKACRFFAQHVVADDHRKLLLEMAKTWIVLAAEQEGMIMRSAEDASDQFPPGMRRLH